MNALGDVFGKLGFSLIGQELTVVRGNGFEVFLIGSAECFEALKGIFKMPPGPGAVAGAEQGEGEVVMGLSGVRVLLTEKVAAGFQGHHVHFARLFVEAGCLIEGTEVTADRGGFIVLLAELRVDDFQSAQEMGFGGIKVAGAFVEEAEVIGHGGDIEHERRLMLFEEINGALPMLGGLFDAGQSVISGTQGGVKAADLAEAVRAIVELVDGLAIILAGGVEVAEFAMDVAADFEGGGKGVDAIEIGAEGLLAFFHGSRGGVQRLIEVTSSVECCHTIL